jgi:hypothetical protein
VDGACAGGACVGGACIDRACRDRACVGRACGDGAYIDGACTDGACVDGACDIIYSKSPTIPLGNSRFIYISIPIRLEILLRLKVVKNLLVLI